MPTCRPDEPLHQVRERVRPTGWTVCVVIDEKNVVLGSLEADVLQATGEGAAEAAMTCAPRTYRLDGSLSKMKEYMQKHHTDHVLIADPDGILVGLVRQADLPAS